jgi:hypothetical protein
MDSESLGVLQRAAAEAEGLPVSLSGRLRGDTFGALRADARQALKDFGFTEPQARDEHGRFTMNDAIRAQAGYPAAGATPPERPVGDLGVGKGAGATPMARRQPSMNDIIRGTAAAGHSTAVLFAEQIASERHGA